MPQAVQVKTGAWDPEEDDLLYYWQSKVGNKWSEVAKHIPGRTGQQCAQRWRHKVNPNIRRDKWTADEDAKLIELVKTFGVGRWAEIARNCDGRTDQQCMGRWRRHLDPSIRRDSWSTEEDAKLRQLHAQYGTSWSRISKCLKGRTSQQCRARWHQINNGRGRATPASNGGSSAAASSAVRQSAAAANKRSAQAGRRRTSRRRSDFSASEDEEDEEEEEDFEEPEEEPEEEEHVDEGEGQYDGAAAAAAATLTHHCSSRGVGLNSVDDTCFAAVAPAGGLYAYSMELPAPGQQQHQWNSSLVAAAAAAAVAAAAVAGQHRGDLAYPADQEDDTEEETAGYDEEEDHEDEEGLTAGAADPMAGRGSSSRHYKVPGASSRYGMSDRHGAHAGASSFSRTAATMSPKAAWQQSVAGQAHWSPSRLLLSPPQVSRAEQLARRGSSSRATSSRLPTEEPNDEETAGAETLLQMAHLLRRESCEFEPPSLRRSDFITASTPPKRTAVERPDDEALPDELSPSPYKRARSSRSALFRQHDEEEEHYQQQHHHGSRNLQHKMRSKSDTAAVAAAVAAAAGSSRHVRGDIGGEQAGFGSRHSRLRQGTGPQAELHAAAAAEEDDDSFMEAAGVDGQQEGEEQEEGCIEEQGHPGFDEAGTAPPDGLVGPVDLLDFGLGGGCSSGGTGYLGAPQELPEPPARPSNASSLTGGPACTAEACGAADSMAAAFLSPPPVSRVPGSSSRSMITPRRPTAQQNLMNLLGSPSFDRVAACASPPSAGRTQPSAATLAALQSPQPSCVHEPFWTPFTGLFKDALFSRGTSATPDLPSAGKARVGSLFSPAGKRSGSGSKGAGRRHGLSTASPGGADDCLQAADGTGATSMGDAAASESELGPSPACGLQQSLPAVHHRVVRRLDQHEAWGAVPAPSPGPAAKDASKKMGGGSKADVLLGGGFSLFSPVRKQRVPLFNEGSAITIGASPAKLDVTGDDPLAIAPLTHNLPCGSSSSQVQAEAGSGSPCGFTAAGNDVNLAHGRSALGPKVSGSRAPAASWKRPPTSSLLSSPGYRLLSRQQQEQQQPEAMAMSPAEAAQEQQPQSQEQQQQAEQQQQEQHLADPDTPVNLKSVSADNTSCSGTPNTPGQRQACSSGVPGQSPSACVTPQHRLRPSRPLAPLHKDCLIAAATKTLAGSVAAAAASQDERSNGHITPSTATGGITVNAAQVTAPEVQVETEQGEDEAAASVAVAVAAAAAAIQGAAQASVVQQKRQQEQDRLGSAPGSADSSKLSPDQLMDSPLQPCQQLQSPSQWHQGMVAMLRNLQQTPLQPNGCAGSSDAAVVGAAASVQAADAVAPDSKGCEGGVRTGSRALRRLQDELERGSSMAAATQQQQQKQQQQQLASTSKAAAPSYVVCAASESDVQQVPFSTALAITPQAGAAALLGGSSTPMVLPLFNQAAAVVPSSSQAAAAANGGRGGSSAVATPLTGTRGSSCVASVSLTPAVISCSRAEGSQLLALSHTPASSAMSLVTPAALPGLTAAAGSLQFAAGATPGVSTPAVAWPVQQRPDGGLVMAALPGGMAAGDGAAAAAGGLVHLTPSAVAGGTGGCASGTAGGASRLVSMQPAMMLLSGVKGGPGLQQSLFALQPSPASAGELKAVPLPAAAAAASSVGGATPATTGLDLRCDSSHIVRSRLHALIDGV